MRNFFVALTLGIALAAGAQMASAPAVTVLTPNPYPNHEAFLALQMEAQRGDSITPQQKSQCETAIVSWIQMVKVQNGWGMDVTYDRVNRHFIRTTPASK